MSGEPGVPAAGSSGLLPDGEARQFFELWAAGLAQVLGTIASTPFAIENLAERQAEFPALDSNDVQIVVVASGGLRGEMSLRLPRVSALGMAHLFLGETPAAAAELQAEHRQALEELVRQVAGHTATTAKSRWGEVQFQVQSASVPSWAAAAGGWLVSAHSSPSRVWVEWRLSAALNAALVAAAPPVADATASVPRSVTSGSARNPLPEGNLDLLMDVALEVTLRFGECNLLLREILELGAGSVLELDRKIGEPADLLLDGRVVARGEVVVVDGNYGMRVLEVVTPVIRVLRVGE